MKILNEAFEKISSSLYRLTDIELDGIAALRAETTSGAGVKLVTIYADEMKPENLLSVLSCYNRGSSSESLCSLPEMTGVHDLIFVLPDNLELDSVDLLERYPHFDDNETAAEYAMYDKSGGIDSLEATDMLGRKVVSVEDVGCRKNKRVGIFYWTWREEAYGMDAVNVTKIIEQYPGAEYNMNHPAWGEHSKCHWNEPLYGYYRSDDPYVIRRHAILLAAAGIDMVMFDCTNGSFLWRDSYEAVLKGFAEARRDGIKAPQIAFMLNFAPMHETELMLRFLYQNLYKPGLYRDLWFMLDGKPFIMAYPDAISENGNGGEDKKLLDEIRSFFTFRPGQPLYEGGAKRSDQWGWLESYPQNKYCVRSDGSCEMMTVGVAQNRNDELICTYFNNADTYGRSYTNKEKHKKLSPDSYKYGYNFQEQWDRAIQADPDFVFVTGWNEWMMGRWREPWVKDPNSTQIAFVDQFDREHSRDIELDRDGQRDTYYLQLVSNVRRFKGTYPRIASSAETTINIKGDISQWDSVKPEYLSERGSTANRKHLDLSGKRILENDTGRNNIIMTKVARDSQNIYFLAETAEPLTIPEDCDDRWMCLLIDIDRNKATGWEGYDYIINRSRNGQLASIEHHVCTADGNTFTFEKVGEAEYHAVGRILTISLPRNLVAGTEKLNFEFKWSDNMQNHDIIDFYENGDTAPLGRFNYLYKE